MKRTSYMELLMITTYPMIAIEALKGGFDGAWERLIAQQLEKDCKADESEAIVIAESVGNDFMKAAHLIISSKIENYDTVK